MLKYLAKSLSRFLAGHPRLLLNAQQIWLKIGHDWLDLRMASWVVRRPEWLRARPIDNLLPIEDQIAADGNSSVEIAKRLIRYFDHVNSAADEAIPADTIWGVLRQTHYGELVRLVKSSDKKALATYLCRLFRTETVDGYTYGSTFNAWPHRWHYLPIQIELSAVQLAESVGLIRTECHEQGDVAFWRKLVSEEQLMTGLESFFGFRIEQPRHGDPRGIIFGGRFLTRETCSHLHSAYKMARAIEEHGPPGSLKIVEIGGGFGGTTYWLRKLIGDRIENQAIVDLPEVSLVQAYFLGMPQGDEVLLLGENAIEGKRPVLLVPYNDLQIIDFQPNVVINQDSMPEMPQDEAKRYLNWISENLDGLFISFNQETLSLSGSDVQLSVPALVSECPRLKRVSREASWDRRGYVEEVYSTQ